MGNELRPTMGRRWCEVYCGDGIWLVVVLVLGLLGCGDAPPQPMPGAAPTVAPAVASGPPAANTGTGLGLGLPPEGTDAFTTALAQYGAGDATGAVSLLRATLARGASVSSQLALPLAAILLETGNLGEAEPLLTQAANAPGAGPEPRLLLGELLASRGRDAEARAAWASLPMSLPADAASRLAVDQLVVALRHGDISAARTHLAQVSPDLHGDVRRQLSTLMAATESELVEPDTPIHLPRPFLLAARMTACDEAGLATAARQVARTLADMLPPDDPDPLLSALRGRALAILSR